MNNVIGYIWEWTTEVPQSNETNGQAQGGCANNASGNVASYRLGANSATLNTHWCIGFRPVLLEL